MLKNKQKYQSGSFATKSTGKGRKLIMALTVMIFVLGGGLLAYNKIFKITKVSQTIEAPTSEIPGWWYQKYFGLSVCEKDNCRPEADPDQDKLTNAQEYFYHTDPLKAHTVGDELNDGELVARGFDPSRTGRLTFEEVTSEDYILGESLLFDTDIKKLVAEDLNLSNVRIPLVNDDELQIIKEESEEVYKNYIEQMQETINKHFPAQRIDSVVAIMQSGDDSDIEEIRSKILALTLDLKKIPVPEKLIMYHKYTITLTFLISAVIDPKAVDTDAWFDRVQELLATQQKLSLEANRLSREP